VFPRDALTLVAPRAWPPSEFDHITDQIGNAVAVKRAAALLVREGA
jgi:hypothetical protein